MDSTLLISTLVVVGMVAWLVKLSGGFGKNLSQEGKLTQQITIDNYSFPSSVAAKVSETYPHLSSFQVESVLKGLRQFFHMCCAAGPGMNSFFPRGRMKNFAERPLGDSFTIHLRKL